ncbi:hypothetical protein BKA82DRAFT_4357130 [Pisolithus tinctorius]|nr:hypothetical protein BKA82DRAFT_4357130 [Pisolithus tinctorius]
MESQYESDTWDQTERDDADGERDIEPSDVGEREEETFEVEELEILGCRRQEWRQAGKKKKPAVLLSIWEEMQGLDRNKELRGSKVQTKCKLIQDWLKKPLRSKKPHITLRSSYKYSVQAVVCELYQEQIQERLAKMKVEEGDTHGSKQIQQYQNALMAFIQDDLTEEQLAAAEDIAERWNGQEGPACEVRVYPWVTGLQDRVTGVSPGGQSQGRKTGLKSKWPKSRPRDRGQVRLDWSQGRRSGAKSGGPDLRPGVRE